jgi:hypothetical protein
MASVPTSYPLGPPTVSGNVISLDTMLSEPTRITRYLSDLTLRGLFATKIFSNGGAVTGGALIYDQLTLNQLFTDVGRDVQNVEPGAEFPIVTSSRQAPLVAQVEKFGGKFFVTDEARDRNDVTSMRIPAQQLANTIQRKIDTRALAVIDASIAAIGSAVTMTGVNWSTAGATGVSSNAQGMPAVDFAKAQLAADTAELGVHYDTWIVNPAQMAALQIAYSPGWQDVLNTWGVTMIASNRVAAGTAYVLEAGMVGELRLEQPLQTVTYREEGTERTWVKSSVRPVFAVTNPYSLLKVTGLAG